MNGLFSSRSLFDNEIAAANFFTGNCIRIVGNCPDREATITFYAPLPPRDRVSSRLLPRARKETRKEAGGAIEVALGHVCAFTLPER